MISSQSRTPTWIKGIREISRGKDPILIEKMIMALTLVEELRLSGLDFIFKGGSSLILLFGPPQRFSIDIDIVLIERQDLDEHFQVVLNKGVFHRYEENKRPGELPKQHYKFFFNSVIEAKESHILLDILFEENPYPRLQEVGLQSPLLSVDGKITQVICPTVEGLLGDKLTAFAPHTTGILYGTNKELEIAKQLFDIGLLFDAAADLKLVRLTFENVASTELAYRTLSELTPDDVLQDAFGTACLIGLRGSTSGAEYAELLEGFKKFAAFVYSGYFSLDTAIVCAAKAAYLVTLLLKRESTITRIENGQDLSSWNISNPDYNKLNKLKKTSPEAFFYYFRALELLNLVGK
jgi:predicted nucleotidyltransferase component of viral defense system